MNDWLIAIVISSLFTGFMLGWAGAHGEVRTECQRLGAFYVGDTVFECKVKAAP